MIYPIPVKEEYQEGMYTLKSTYPMEGLYEFTRAAKIGSQDFAFIEKEGYAEEEYDITITDENITIGYGSEAGIYRALTSVYQMAVTDGIRIGTIYDKPQFGRRGYMLDISRSKIPTRKTILEYIDILTLLKYNEFQLYMESLCYKYERYPEYTKDFDCLTAADIIIIEKYCEERFIDLVPNQNCFGHMSAWLKFEEFKPLGIGDGIKNSGSLNPLDERSLEFADGLFESLLPYFKSEFVNIGCDEVGELGTFQTKDACEVNGRENVFMDYLNKVNDLVGSKYQKKIMFWDDMIVNYPSCYNRIPQGAIAMEWGYELIQSQIMAERCINFKNNGIPFYVCPSVNTHLAFTGRFDVTSFNLRTAGEVGRDHGAVGYLVTDWGNTGNPHFPYTAYLPCALGAQYAWNVGVAQDGETFKTEFIYGAEDFCDQFLFHAKLARLLYRLANYYLLEPERIHVGTMCGHTFFQPMKTTPTKFVNLDKSGDAFYFNNVDRYVREIMEDIRKVDVDEILKREILLNAQMVLFANMLNKVRVENRISEENYKQAECDAAAIETEFKILWDVRNFTTGKETYLNALHKRMEEMKEYICY